jgi:hypothetical protein
MSITEHLPMPLDIFLSSATKDETLDDVAVDRFIVSSKAFNSEVSKFCTDSVHPMTNIGQGAD